MAQDKFESFGISCDLEGIVNELIYDNDQFDCIETGKSFLDFIDEGSQEKASNFLNKIKLDSAVYDWELNMVCNQKLMTVHLSGFLVHDKLLLFGASSIDTMYHIMEHMMKINNDQNNALREVMKDLTAYHQEYDDNKNITGNEVDLYEELGRLNNELTNAQRELTKKNIELLELNHQKEVLLKEIHHRVKNNLMIISSLLNLQSNYLKDEESRGIFKESQNRAKSMALIHERLYRSTDLKNIDFKEYITTLAHDLYRTYVEDPSLVDLKLDIEDVNVDINTAIPLGLILNELITNSMKYAFPNDVNGTVTINFSKREDEFILRVSDDGVGFPEDIDFRNTNTLGLQLVNSLIKQINGAIELDRSNGAEFKLSFKEF